MVGEFQLSVTPESCGVDTGFCLVEVTLAKIAAGRWPLLLSFLLFGQDANVSKMPDSML